MKTITKALLFFFFLPQFLLAVPNQLSKPQKIKLYKKVKIKLNDKSSFSGFIVKVEDDLLYTVNSRKERKKALNNDCANCRVIPMSDIKKIRHKGFIWGIVILILLVGVILFGVWVSAVTGCC